MSVSPGPETVQALPAAPLSMNISDLYTLGKTTIPDYVQQLVDALETIISTLDGLKLNWVGESQKEADDINRRWNANATALFGTQKNPEQGVLLRIAGGIAAAALNYSNVEAQLVAMYQKYDQTLKDLAAGVEPPASDGSTNDNPPIVES